MDFLFKWESQGDATVKFHAPRETRHIFELHVEILGREMPDDMRLIQLARWCSQFTKLDQGFIFVHELGLEQALDLANTIACSAGLTLDALSEVSHFWNIVSGADRFDPEEEPALCECPACKGDEEHSSICKLNGITERGRLLAEWSFYVRHPHYADQPYAVYQMAKVLNRAKAEGMAADRQKREADKGNSNKHDEARKRREKHGHKW